MLAMCKPSQRTKTPRPPWVGATESCLGKLADQPKGTASVAPESFIAHADKNATPDSLELWQEYHSQVI